MKELRLTTGRRIVIDYEKSCLGESPRDWNSVTRLIGVPNREVSLDETYDDWFELKEAKDEAIEAGDHVFNLYKFSHGNVLLSIKPFNDPWDSGQIGYCIVRSEVYGNRETAARVAQAELDTFNKWLNGEVYEILIEHPEGFDTVIDDCFGGCYIDSENDLIDMIKGLDLTKEEQREALDNLDKLMP